MNTEKRYWIISITIVLMVIATIFYLSRDNIINSANTSDPSMNIDRDH